MNSMEFREAPRRAVAEALLVPGEIVRATIYRRIERTRGLEREEIPEKLGTFDKAPQDSLQCTMSISVRRRPVLES